MLRILGEGVDLVRVRAERHRRLADVRHHDLRSRAHAGRQIVMAPKERPRATVDLAHVEEEFGVALK